MLHISLLYLRQLYLRQWSLPIEAGKNDIVSILDLVVVVVVVDTMVVVAVGIDMVGIVFEMVDNIFVAIFADVVSALIHYMLKS